MHICSMTVIFIGGAQEALLTLEKALALAKHVSEIRDVLTAMAIAKLQIAIEEEGLSKPMLL